MRGDDVAESMPKMPPPLGRRKTSNGAGKSPAVEDFARHSGKGAHDAGAATAAGKERGTRSKRAGKFTAVEDLARYSVEDAQDAAAAGNEGDKVGCRHRGGDKE